MSNPFDNMTDEEIEHFHRWTRNYLGRVLRGVSKKMAIAKQKIELNVESEVENESECK